MGCLDCSLGNNCDFSIQKALADIASHYNHLKDTVKKNEEDIKYLRDRNDRLSKAVKVLKKTEPAQNERSWDLQDRSPSSSIRTEEKIHYIDLDNDDRIEESRNDPSLMDTALNGTALDVSNQSEIIAETERPSPRAKQKRTRRPLMLGMRRRKIHDNDENKKPEKTKISKLPTPPKNKEESKNRPSSMSTKTENKLTLAASKISKLHIPSKNKEETKNHSSSMSINIENKHPLVTSKISKFQTPPKSKEETKNHPNSMSTKTENKLTSNKSMLSEKTSRLLRQTRLDFKALSEETHCPKVTSQQNDQPNSSTPAHNDDVFEFHDETETFNFGTSKDDAEIDAMLSNIAIDRSLIPVSPPNPSIIILDDTRDTVRLQAQETPKKISRSLENCFRGSQDFYAVRIKEEPSPLSQTPEKEAGSHEIKKNLRPLFEGNFNKPADGKSLRKRQSDDNDFELNSPTHRSTKNIFKKPKAERTALNPVLCSQETDDDSADEGEIDWNKINCNSCKNFAKNFVGSMSVAKILEHIRKCPHHRNDDEFCYETPENFWNPLLISFGPDDPRNEVLIDDRLAKKKAAAASAKKN